MNLSPLLSEMITINAGNLQSSAARRRANDLPELAKFA